MNKAFLVCEVKDTPKVERVLSGTLSLSLELVVRDSYQKNGEDFVSEETHYAVASGKLAQDIKETVQAGATVVIDGRLLTSHWDDDFGTRHFETSIEVLDLVVVASPGDAAPPRHMNKILLAGGLASVPMLTSTRTGSSVAKVTLATTRRVRGERGWDEKADFHRLVAWANLAEGMGKSLEKGQQIEVEGRLRSNSFTDRNGVQHHGTEVEVKDVKYGAKSRRSRQDEEEGAA